MIADMWENSYDIPWMYLVTFNKCPQLVPAIERCLNDLGYCSLGAVSAEKFEEQYHELKIEHLINCIGNSSRDNKEKGVNIFREIVGNPYILSQRSYNPEWSTLNNSRVKNIAIDIYRHQEYNTMPILADALEDAGCDNKNILEHLRNIHCKHIPDCWVLSLILDTNTIRT